MDNYFLQDQLSLDGFYYVNRFYNGDVSSNEVPSEVEAWIFSMKKYSSGITAKRKTALRMSQSEESFLSGKCFLCSIKNFL